MADQGHSADIIWSSEVELSLLGPVRLSTRAGDDLTPKGRKTRALLAILALAGGAVPRGRLIALLWGDRADDQAKASLRQALYELRALGASGYLRADRETVALGPKRLRVDVREVAQLSAGDMAARIGQAQWPPLAGLDDLTPELDVWLRDERARVTRSVLATGIEAGERALSDGQADDARAMADALERADPLDERSARLGIRADLAAGDRVAACRRHARLRDRLRQDLDVAPAPETDALLADAPPSPAHRPKAVSPAPEQATMPRSHPPKRWWAIAAVALLAVVAVAAAILLRPVAVQPTPTLAVLPFAGAGQAREGYLAGGLSDEILNLLGQGRLRVLGRMSAAQVAARPDPVAAARDLGVTHLVDGTVRSDGGRLLVMVRLTRVADGTQIWSDRFERRAGDIFTIQSNVAEAVAARLASTIAGARAPRTTRPDVYERYLAARQLLRERRAVTLEEARRLLEQAVADDPDYAPAVAELSGVTMLLGDAPSYYGSIPQAQARARATALARRALALDPQLGEAYAAMAFVNPDRAEAERLFSKAVELSPQRPEYHRWLANELFKAGAFPRAIREYERAIAIDPLWGLNYEHLTGALIMLGRGDEARAHVRRFLALSTDNRAKLQLLRALAANEARHADLYRLTRQIQRAYPDERVYRESVAEAAAALGNRAEAIEMTGAHPIVQPILRSDWDALARNVSALGAGYWDYGAGYWSNGALLVASGHGSTLVDTYDAAQPGGSKTGRFDDRFAAPELILALRQQGRRGDAQRLLAAYRDKVSRGPRQGIAGVDRAYNLAIIAALQGNRRAAIAQLEAASRAKPLLVSYPLLSLRRNPLFATVAGDPRLAAIDERMRAAVNAQRRMAGLAPIDSAGWLSDPRTLLTKD